MLGKIRQLFSTPAPAPDLSMLPDGNVIWHEYDISGEEPDTWRVASREERTSALILASERMPQLAALLPRRLPQDADCVECEASGYLFDGRILCRRCGGTGWVAVV